ncbi:MAG TPA: hypothetical protein VIY90_16370 [Steroidobacteraceae bacterium]
MPDISQIDPAKAFQEGRRLGLATAALALSITGFVNLLGAEKPILAGVLALMALRGSAPSRAIFSRGRAALALAAIYLVTLVAVCIIFHEKLLQLLQLLQKLG